METAREYELEPDSYFVGAELFTAAVDYTNSTVQVSRSDTLALLALTSLGHGKHVQVWLLFARLV